MSACIYYTYEYEKKGWTRAKWAPPVSDEPGAHVKTVKTLGRQRQSLFPITNHE